ncbi:E3 ubiquitin-protein ligase listerin-like isoform X1 [Zingiber officinale]|uniref:E3 ubiquitin-protein ligase listerin-like isoform X1 n=4 Tax=Zingiber officinale TaxID=94328 RepID=UPI001C4B2413|nr:E3 ubiquitin-protein ligase listerin-like isoform X1 [Zingiber officinale]
MGKPKGDGARSKSRPSSSSSAASLLPSGVSTVGFGGYLGSSRVDSSSLAEDSVAFLDVDSEMTQHLKRLGRKDPTTKLKALTTLAVLFKEKPTEELVQIIPQWAFEYRKLLHDFNREARRATHDTMTALVMAIRKGLAPHLKSLMGPWWFSQFDPVPEVSLAARLSLEAAFPMQERRLDALMFCVNEIFLYLDENLKLTPQTMFDKAIPADELEDMHQRAISSSLLAIATLIDILLVVKMPNSDNGNCSPEQKLVSRARTAAVSSVENLLAMHKCFLQHMKSKHPSVRTATYSIIASIIKNIPHVLNEENVKVLSTAILGVLQEKDASCHSSMWDMLLLFSKKIPNGWSYCNTQKVVLNRFWHFLRNGCHGSQQVSYPVLVLFLDSIPTDVNLGEQFVDYFFQNLWAGRYSSCHSLADSKALFGAFKECFLWVLHHVSRYCKTTDDQSELPIKLINDIFVELLLNDYLLSASVKKRDESSQARSDISTDGGSSLSHERPQQRVNSSHQAFFTEELLRCIIGILLEISQEDQNLTCVFCTSFQKDCLEIIREGDSLQNFPECIERIVRFFLAIDKCILLKGHDWPLHFLGRPLFFTTFPVIKSMDSLDAVKLLSILVEIFGPDQIFSEFDSPNAMDIETKTKHFFHTFNNDFIPWCLEGVGSFGNLKLDFLLDLFQDDYFFQQWCAVITYCVDDTKFTETSDNISNIQVLAILIGKVRERIRSKKLGRLRKFGLSPEHWHHDLLNSSAISFAHQTSMINCHAQFLCAVLGGSAEDDQLCFLSKETLIIVWEGILRKMTSLLTSSSFHWVHFACSLILGSDHNDFLKLQEASFSMKVAMAQFSFEVLKGSIFCLKIIDDSCTLVSSLLATLFVLDWENCMMALTCTNDKFDCSKYAGDIDNSLLETEVLGNEEQVDAKLALGRKFCAYRRKITPNFLKNTSRETQSRFQNILVKIVRFALLDSDDLVSPKESISFCEWVLDMAEIICDTRKEMQILLDQLFQEGKSWPFWVKSLIDSGNRVATFQRETASLSVNEHHNHSFVAFADKLVSRLGVDVVIAGLTEISIGSSRIEVVSGFSSPYKREWLAAEIISSWEWQVSNATEAFLPLLSKYARTETSTLEANILFSIINTLIDGAITHETHDHWASFDSWRVLHDEFDKINDPFLRGLVSLLSTLFVKEKVWGKCEAIQLFKQLMDKLYVGTSVVQYCLRILPFILSIIIPSALENSESDGTTEEILKDSLHENPTRKYVMSWLENSLSFPSIISAKTEQDVEEWIQAVISCYPLRTTMETGKFEVSLLRNVSNEEATLLLSLFRKQVCFNDASAATNQKQIILGKLIAVSVGYCWQKFDKDDWSFVLDNSHRWLESSVLLLEEITDSIDDAIVNHTIINGLECTQKKLEISLQNYDPWIFHLSTAALVTLCLLSQPEEHEKTDSTEALHHIKLGKWAAMKDQTMASILRLFFATGASEAIANSCNGNLSNVVASSRLMQSHFWGMIASFVWNSPKLVRSAAVESMKLWGLSKDSISSLYAILFSSRPISSLQFAAYCLLSSEPLCHLSVASEGSLEGEGSSFMESELSLDVESSSEETFCLRDEISFLIQRQSADLPEMDLISQERVNVFIAWALLLSCLNSFSPSSKAREKMVQYIQDSVSSTILDCIFQHIPLKSGANNVKKKEIELAVEASNAANAARHSITTCSLELYVQSLWPVRIDTMASLAGSIYGMMIHLLPSYVRNWFSSLRDRSLSSAVESFTKAWCSPPLLLDELSQVKETVFADDNFSVSVNRSASEIIATYKKEETGMDLVIHLPSSYPLRPVDVECARSLGISEVKQRKWLLSLTAFVRNQNGAIAEAIRIWKSNFDKEFLGVEECPICYSINHTTNHSLPRLACKTCKHKFHSACLYKWFSTSHKSTCPLCQSPF